MNHNIHPLDFILGIKVGEFLHSGMALKALIRVTGGKYDPYVGVLGIWD